MDKHYRLEELSPCVREVGLQMRDSWRKKPRRIYDHEFLYCFRGNAAIHIHGEEHLITEGDLVIIPPDTPHNFWVDETKDGELYYLHCDLEYREDSDWVDHAGAVREAVRRGTAGARAPAPERPVF